MILLLQLILNATVNASIFSLLAVGFGLVYRSLRFFHIAFGAVYIISTYALIAGMQLAGFPPSISVISGLFIGALVSLVMDRAVYLPLERAGTFMARAKSEKMMELHQKGGA